MGAGGNTSSEEYAGQLGTESRWFVGVSDHARERRLSPPLFVFFMRRFTERSCRQFQARLCRDRLVSLGGRSAAPPASVTGESPGYEKHECDDQEPLESLDKEAKSPEQQRQDEQ